MRAHWDTWFTEAHVAKLAEYEVEIVRLPIGDWTFDAYGPYIGCMDGASEKITWALDTFEKYNIKVLIDVHGLIDSQNGYASSGKEAEIEWIDESHYKETQKASWMGNWNGKSYDSINQSNINHALNTMKAILKTWGDHPAFYALEPVNEPW